MKNIKKFIFKSDIIRKALRDTPINITVVEARRLRDHVKNRVKYGERYCHICISGDKVLSHRSSRAVRRFMEKNSISVMESKCAVWISNYNKNTDYHYAGDPLRLEFLRILVDTKRNRKGKTQ